jgi:hypothetical protein
VLVVVVSRTSKIVSDETCLATHYSSEHAVEYGLEIDGPLFIVLLHKLDSTTWFD